MKPFNVASAMDWHAIYNGSLAQNATAQIAFTPVGYSAPGPPAGAPGGAKAALVAHEILVTNPGTFAIEIAVGADAQGGPMVVYRPNSVREPAWIDPTTLPAVSAANKIIVPAGAIAFPIRVKALGITISSPNGATTPSVQAYGPLSIQA